MPFGADSRGVGPMNHVLDRWRNAPGEETILGSCPAHWKALGVSAAVIQSSITAGQAMRPFVKSLWLFAIIITKACCNRSIRMVLQTKTRNHATLILSKILRWVGRSINPSINQSTKSRLRRRDGIKYNKGAKQDNENIKHTKHSKTRQLEYTWKQERFQVPWEDVHGGDMSCVRWKVVPSSRRCDGERAVAECWVSTWQSDGQRLCRPQTSSVA